MLSVIIPAHNEEKYLPDTLEALSRTEKCEFECIVVANGCTDDTARIAGDFPVKVIVEKRAGISNALNVGAADAHYDYLLFLDADIQVVPDFLRALEDKAEKNRAAVVTGDSTPDIPTARARLFLAAQNFFHYLFRVPMGYVLTRKDVFEKIDGFDESTEPAQDMLFAHRAMHYGKFTYLRHPRPVMSMRRFEKLGYIRTTLIWITGRFCLGRKYPVVR